MLNVRYLFLAILTLVLPGASLEAQTIMEAKFGSMLLPNGVEYKVYNKIGSKKITRDDDPNPYSGPGKTYYGEYRVASLHVEIAQLDFSFQTEIVYAPFLDQLGLKVSPLGLFVSDDKRNVSLAYLNTETESVHVINFRRESSSRWISDAELKIPSGLKSHVIRFEFLPVPKALAETSFVAGKETKAIGVSTAVDSNALFHRNAWLVEGVGFLEVPQKLLSLVPQLDPPKISDLAR